LRRPTFGSLGIAIVCPVRGREDGIFSIWIANLIFKLEAFHLGNADIATKRKLLSFIVRGHQLICQFQAREPKRFRLVGIGGGAIQRWFLEDIGNADRDFRAGQFLRVVQIVEL